MDTKKKELLVGAYKNGSQEWQPHGRPEPVNVRDFVDKQLGKANPYGVYDVAADTGWVSVGRHRSRHRRVRRGHHPPLVAGRRRTHLPERV
uniref:Rhodopirellula transposase n=1 Tax=Mycobacterium riyadhense TaxID=486698 RepID=A0A653F0Q5_9MYCO|nr:Rhodopirellula transposase [Mycobacterium riyadhense]